MAPRTTRTPAFSVRPRLDASGALSPLVSVVDRLLGLSTLEARNGIPDGTTRILPVATETAGAVLALPTIAGSTSRLSGLTWGGEDLAADIGAEANHDETGYTATYIMARSMALPVFSGMLIELVSLFVVPVFYCGYMELKLNLGLADHRWAEHAPSPDTDLAAAAIRA